MSQGVDPIIDMDLKLKNDLNVLLYEHNVSFIRMYTPSRNSIKIVLLSEVEINKIMTNKDYFTHKGFYPTISMTLKAGRTVFCSGFDLTLLRTYDTETIERLLRGKGWDVLNVYIMKNKTSFKVEFYTTNVANAFLNDSNTGVGGIKLLNNQKEPEVDRTIIQCWKCGILNPDHLTKDCTQEPKCLKCGSTHQFFDCPIPKVLSDMNVQQKAARHCISCGTFGDHTSLDYSICPTVRDIIQQRIRDSRDKRQQLLRDNQRDLTLMKNAMIDLSKSKTADWPLPNTNQQQKQISTIVMLSLLDEAVTPGTFQGNLTKACQDNGLPDIKYALQTNTAQVFFRSVHWSIFY